MQFKFFLLPTLSPLQAKYHFPSIIIAQGLQKLGVPFGGNIDYWMPENDNQYLFKATAADCPVHIYDCLYIQEKPETLQKLDKSKTNIFIDYADGLETYALGPISQKFDLVLRAHYTKHLPYAPNVVSWPFALSERILHAIDATLQQEIEPRAMITYRVNLDLRRLTNDHFLPLLQQKYPIYHFESEVPPPEIAENSQSYWWQTGRRHDPKYYQELNKSMLNMAFGGIFAPKPYPRGIANKLGYNASRTLLKLMPGLKAKGYLQYIFQYDSWRLWESFAANTCPVFINFEHWGLQWPKNPVPGEHYLEVDITNYPKSAKRILGMSTTDIMQIGKKGREWALENYAPVPMANRFLNLVDGIKK